MKIDKDIPFEVAALVVCGAPTGWGSATRVAEIRPGESVVIMGIGGVGMSALQGAAAAVEPIIALTEGRMAQKSIITVVEMRGEYVEQALTLTCKAGRCVLTAMDHMADMDEKLNMFLFSMLQKDLQGHIFGGGNARTEAPNLLAMYKSGQLNLDDMITRTYSLEEVNDGYRDMLDAKNIRGVIRYTDADR